MGHNRTNMRQNEKNRTNNKNYLRVNKIISNFAAN